MGIDKINRLLDYIDENTLTYDKLKTFKYDCLIDLFFATKEMSNGKMLYRQIINKIFDINVNYISSKEKISVVFLVDYFESWGGLEVYKKFKENPRFEVNVCVALNKVYDTLQIDKYQSTFKSLTEKGISPIHSFDLISKRIIPWDEMAVDPDLIFYPTAYVNQADNLLLQNLTLNRLCLYIPYSYSISENLEGNFYEMQYNMATHNVFWKRFELVKSDMEDAEKYSHIGSSNAVFSGYSKMDSLMEAINNNIAPINYWKIAPSLSNFKPLKIIYASHHSFPGPNSISMATFMDNYNVIYELAQKYRESTSWIVRPHPQLGRACEKNGIMSELDYKNYLEKWERLPNAHVHEYGDYFDIFRTSDIMIMDCSSFLAEYIFVNKPLLFLTNPTTRFDELGKMCFECFDSAPGSDYAAIEKFITDHICTIEDTKKAKRENVFNNILNYYKINGHSASYHIYQHICNELKVSL